MKVDVSAELLNEEDDFATPPLYYAPHQEFYGVYWGPRGFILTKGKEEFCFPIELIRKLTTTSTTKEDSLF